MWLCICYYVVENFQNRIDDHFVVAFFISAEQLMLCLYFGGDEDDSILEGLNIKSWLHIRAWCFTRRHVELAIISFTYMGSIWNADDPRCDWRRRGITNVPFHLGLSSFVVGPKYYRHNDSSRTNFIQRWFSNHIPQKTMHVITYPWSSFHIPM